MSTAHPPRCLAHARTVQGRQVVSLWSTSAVLSFGSCRMRSIRSPAGTLASIGQVPVTGGGYPPNPGSPSLTWQTITYSNSCVWRACDSYYKDDPGRGGLCRRRYGVIAMALGLRPTLIAGRAMLVAVRIGVTVP